MAFIVPALTIAATALSAAGMVAQGNAAASAARYQGQVAQNNALLADWNARQSAKDQAIAEENAKRAGYAAQERAQQQDRAAAEQIGEVQAAQAASGLRGGSPARVLDTMRELAGIDRLQVRREGDSQADAFRAQARGFEVEQVDLQNRARVLRSDAAMFSREASIARASGYMNAAGAILGGAGSLLGDSAQNPMTRSRRFTDAGRIRATGRGGSLW